MKKQLLGGSAVLVLGLTLLLTGCGGGGGSTDPAGDLGSQLRAGQVTTQSLLTKVNAFKPKVTDNLAVMQDKYDGLEKSTLKHAEGQGGLSVSQLDPKLTTALKDAKSRLTQLKNIKKLTSIFSKLDKLDTSKGVTAAGTNTVREIELILTNLTSQKDAQGKNVTISSIVSSHKLGVVSDEKGLSVFKAQVAKLKTLVTQAKGKGAKVTATEKMLPILATKISSVETEFKSAKDAAAAKIAQQKKDEANRKLLQKRDEANKKLLADLQNYQVTVSDDLKKKKDELDVLSDRVTSDALFAIKDALKAAEGRYDKEDIRRGGVARLATRVTDEISELKAVTTKVNTLTVESDTVRNSLTEHSDAHKGYVDSHVLFSKSAEELSVPASHVLRTKHLPELKTAISNFQAAITEKAAALEKYTTKQEILKQLTSFLKGVDPEKKDYTRAELEGFGDQAEVAKSAAALEALRKKYDGEFLTGTPDRDELDKAGNSAAARLAHFTAQHEQIDKIDALYVDQNGLISRLELLRDELVLVIKGYESTETTQASVSDNSLNSLKAHYISQEGNYDRLHSTPARLNGDEKRASQSVVDRFDRVSTEIRSAIARIKSIEGVLLSLNELEKKHASYAVLTKAKIATNTKDISSNLNKESDEALRDNRVAKLNEMKKIGDDLLADITAFESGEQRKMLKGQDVALLATFKSGVQTVHVSLDEAKKVYTSNHILQSQLLLMADAFKRTQFTEDEAIEMSTQESGTDLHVLAEYLVDYERIMGLDQSYPELVFLKTRLESMLKKVGVTSFAPSTVSWTDGKHPRIEMTHSAATDPNFKADHTTVFSPGLERDTYSITQDMGNNSLITIIVDKDDFLEAIFVTGDTKTTLQFNKGATAYHRFVEKEGEDTVYEYFYSVGVLSTRTIGKGNVGDGITKPKQMERYHVGEDLQGKLVSRIHYRAIGPDGRKDFEEIFVYHNGDTQLIDYVRHFPTADPSGGPIKVANYVDDFVTVNGVAKWNSRIGVFIGGGKFFEVFHGNKDSILATPGSKTYENSRSFDLRCEYGSFGHLDLQRFYPPGKTFNGNTKTGRKLLTGKCPSRL